MPASRHDELKHILHQRRRELQDDVRSRIRDGRAGQPKEVRDEAEGSDSQVQADLSLALLQMRTQTLARIDEAIRRLDAGTYGSCAECDEEISERRLRALPFAVRCAECEERREGEQGRARRFDRLRDNLSLFPDAGAS